MELKISILLSWTSYNESTSKVNPPVTKVGMLPILQAPADNNNTVVTVIHKSSGESANILDRSTLLSLGINLFTVMPKNLIGVVQMTTKIL
jgi:hypothetical protein